MNKNKKMRSLAPWLLAFSGAAGFAQAQDPAVSPAEVKINEVIRKQQLELEADVKVGKAVELAQRGDYENAEILFKESKAAYQNCSQSEARLTAKVSDIDARLTVIYKQWSRKLENQAEQSRKAQEYRQAIALLNKAAELDPANQRFYMESVRNLTEKASEADYYAEVDKASIDAGTVARDALSKQKLDRAEILFADRRYAEVLDLIDEILANDLANMPAQHLRLRTLNKMREAAVERKAAMKEDAFAELAFKWVNPTPLLSMELGANLDSRETKKPLLGGIHAKLNSIIIPSVSFQNEAIEAVIEAIKVQAKKLDPDGRGVNINLLLGRGTAAPAAPAAPAPAADPFAVAPADVPAAPADSGSSIAPINLEMNDISLADLIDTLCQSAGLRYKVESSAVIITDGTTQIDDMQTEFFTISSGMVANIEGNAAGGEAGEGADGGRDWQAYFTQLGVPFPPGAKIAYVSNVSRLVITNTAENIRTMAMLIRQFDVPIEQILLEAKVADVDVNNLEELGVMWRYTTPNMVQHANGVNAFNSDPLTPRFMFPQTTTSARLNANIRDVQSVEARTGTNPVQLAADVVLGHEQFQMMIRALDQSDSSEILSAPKVIAQSGNTSIIRVVTERFFPEDWEKPEINDSDVGTAVLPSSPIYGEKKDLGVVLEVTPTVDPDKYTMEIDVHPQIVKFLQYSTEFNRVITVGAANILYRYDMPIIESRTVETKVKVWDGETVVIGGLLKETVTEIDDSIPYISKLPLIGRLFQNKGTSSKKTNMVIFISARMMDQSGQPIRQNNIRGLPDFKRL